MRRTEKKERDDGIEESRIASDVLHRAGTLCSVLRRVRRALFSVQCTGRWSAELEEWDGDWRPCRQRQALHSLARSRASNSAHSLQLLKQLSRFVYILACVTCTSIKCIHTRECQSLQVGSHF